MYWDLPRDPSDQRYLLYPKHFGPSRNWHASSFVFKNHVASAIPLLLFTDSPATVLRAISEIVVDPLDRMLIARSISDISQECGETISPSLADRYSTPAVVGIMLRLWIEAALSHSSPRIVFRYINHPSSFS